MACYLCAGCDNLIDNDWNVCTDVGGKLYCPDCAENTVPYFYVELDEDGAEVERD